MVRVSKRTAADEPRGTTAGARAPTTVTTGQAEADAQRTPAPERGVRASGPAVLVVQGNGTISQVLQFPEAGDSRDMSELVGQELDSLWPGQPAARLAAGAKRAIRSRRVESTEYCVEPDGGQADFIFIPTGPDRVMVVARDISERQAAMSRLQRLAYRDECTNLPNRQFLLEELVRSIESLQLQEGRAAVLCFEIGAIDGAELPGGRQQDALLQEVASRLKHELRGANDLVVEDEERYSVVARIGQNRFGVLLPRIETGEDAESVARRIVQALQQPVRLKARTARITARAGIALFPQDGTDADTLLRNAITALDDASCSHGTPYKFHSGTVRLRALQRQDLELELRSALDRDEFSVEFLPVLSATDRRVTSVEALLRWPQSFLGGQSIRKVISIAENTGLILPIGEWVLDRACEALQAWRAGGHENVRLSVNLSVPEFSLKELPDRIAGVLQVHGIDPEALDVEINEYGLFRDAMQGYTLSTALSQLGVGLVLDGYGTGACSLGQLSRSPVHTIKIDRSFVEATATDETARRTCGAIVALARQLHRKTIAVGVETEEQATLLRRCGCDYLQGFLFGRPVSGDDMLEFLSRGIPA